MFSNSLKKTLESESLGFLKKTPAILDIILFGSTTKGKEKPKDLDLLILFKDKKDTDTTYLFRKLIESKTKMQVEVVSKSYPELFQEDFIAREAFLSGGYSLINKISLAEGLGYKSQVMFIYQLKGKNKSERMRFYYSLYGRNSEGMLDKLKATKQTDTIITCSIENLEPMREYLNSWKIEFKEVPILIPKRLAD
jgi:predicted nucleotidyltransferase